MMECEMVDNCPMENKICDWRSAADEFGFSCQEGDSTCPYKKLQDDNAILLWLHAEKDAQLDVARAALERLRDEGRAFRVGQDAPADAMTFIKMASIKALDQMGGE